MGALCLAKLYHHCTFICESVLCIGLDEHDCRSNFLQPPRSWICQVPEQVITRLTLTVARADHVVSPWQGQFGANFG